MCKDKNSPKRKEGEDMPLAVTKQPEINFNDFLSKNNSKVRRIAKANTVKNKDGQTVLSKDDEWRTQAEWDRHFEELNRHGE